jgi:hypothetical protein
MVRLARDRGWDSLFSGQHYLNEGNNKQLQTVPFLARLAAEAGEMTIGLGILLLNLHNPVYVAETVATLDVIARGNFIFGVGLGYRDIEYDAFGVPKGERVRRTSGPCRSRGRRSGWRQTTTLPSSGLPDWRMRGSSTRMPPSTPSAAKLRCTAQS